MPCLETNSNAEVQDKGMLFKHARDDAANSSPMMRGLGKGKGDQFE